MSASIRRRRGSSDKRRVRRDEPCQSREHQRLHRDPLQSAHFVRRAIGIDCCREAVHETAGRDGHASGSAFFRPFNARQKGMHMRDKSVIDLFVLPAFFFQFSAHIETSIPACSAENPLRNQTLETAAARESVRIRHTGSPRRTNAAPSAVYHRSRPEKYRYAATSAGPA